jgi:hypothetical protein
MGKNEARIICKALDLTISITTETRRVRLSTKIRPKICVHAVADAEKQQPDQRKQYPAIHVAIISEGGMLEQNYLGFRISN